MQDCVNAKDSELQYEMMITKVEDKMRPFELQTRECKAELKNLKYELENKLTQKVYDMQMEKAGQKDDIYSIKNQILQIID